MKKILICVGALGVMSFTSNEMYKNYLLAETLEELQEMQEWMNEDINKGEIEEVLGFIYFCKFRKCELNLRQYLGEEEKE